MIKKPYLIGILIFLAVITPAILYAQFNTAQNEKSAAHHSYDKPLTIISQQGKEHKFKTALAITPRQKRQGLMYVQNLPEDAAMLFWFERPEIQAFWMKNTFIPLDILYIDENGRINQIAHNTKPHDTTSIVSNKPAKAVLEINGGLSKKLGIKEGDHIKFEAIN